VVSAASGERRAAGPASWLRWFVANAAGYAAGFAAWEALFPAVRSMLSRPLGGSLNAAAFGITLGACAGLAQAIALRQRIALAGAWVLATAAGGAVGLVAAAWVGYLLSLAFAAAGAVVSVSDGTEVLTFGLLLGAGVGAGRWLIVRRQRKADGRWLVASAVGLAIGYATAIGIFELTPPMDEPFLGAAFGACAGAIAALVELLFLGRRLHFALLS
jgi:hypothetical protein